eukprot:2582442-Pleurochrysis_carterae.AAC.8
MYRELRAMGYDYSSSHWVPRVASREAARACKAGWAGGVKDRGTYAGLWQTRRSEGGAQGVSTHSSRPPQ